jgi:Planctomycete cytochrome C
VRLSLAVLFTLALSTAGCLGGEVMTDTPGQLPDGRVPDAGPPAIDSGGPVVDAGGTPLTWTNDISPLFGPAKYDCMVCHSTAVKMGSYSIQTYAEAKMGGSDATPNIIPGDANSTLNQEIRPTHNGKTLTAAEFQKLQDWIVIWGAREN